MFNNSIAMRFSESNTYQLCCHIIKNEELCRKCVRCRKLVGAVSSPTARVGSSTACVVAPRGRFAPPPLPTLCGFRPLSRSLRSLPPPLAVGGWRCVRSQKSPAPPFCVPPYRGNAHLQPPWCQCGGEQRTTQQQAVRNSHAELNTHWHLLS